MRLLLATMSHETNTFSPVPTRLERFCRGGRTLLAGAEAIAFYRGTGTCMGGYLAVAEEAGAEVVVPVCASAPPSGPVDGAAFETICGLITDALAGGGFDGIWLDLHGAMVTDRFDDGEGELLRRTRAIAPDTPLCVAYDMHANIFDPMVSLAQVVSGYHTYPHIDQRETAERAARALLRVIRQEVRPVTAWGNAPMLPHVMAQGTHQFPNRELQALCMEWERTGRALSASLFVGFPHADVAMAGLSAVVVTDNDPAAARAMVDELLGRAWEARHDFMFAVEPLEASVARAAAAGETATRPVFLLDHYDNCASGGTMDTTDTLREIIRQGLEDVVFFGIYDPEAVSQAIEAGVGGQVTLSIGAKLPMPDIRGQRTAGGQRCGPDHLVRPVPPEGRADPGPAHRHRPDRGAGHRPHPDRAAEPPHRADGARDVPGPGHRPRRQALRGDQEPRPLARRPGPAGRGDRGMRRRRCLHVRLRAADLPRGPPPGLPAGSGPALEPSGLTATCRPASR